METFVTAVVESLRAMGLTVELQGRGVYVNKVRFYYYIQRSRCSFGMGRYKKTEVTQCVVDVLKHLGQLKQQQEAADRRAMYAEQAKRLTLRPRCTLITSPEGITLSFTHTSTDAIGIAMDLLEEHGLLEA